MVYEGTHKQFTTFINNLVLPEDERSRGRMMETETRVLMETKPWRAMTSKKLELQVNNCLRQRELTDKTNLHTQCISSHKCSQYNLELISTTLDIHAFKHPV